MKISRKILPGHAGTKKYVEQHGDKLVCVRYIYDEQKQIKTKTIELIVERCSWHRNCEKIPKNKIVHINIDYREEELRRLVKSSGGKWIKEKKLWELTYKDVAALGLTDRIVD